MWIAEVKKSNEQCRKKLFDMIYEIVKSALARRPILRRSRQNSAQSSGSELYNIDQLATAYYFLDPF